MYPDPDRKSRFGLVDLVIVGAVAGFLFFLWYRVSEVLVYRWDWSFLPRALVRPNPETGWWEPNLLVEGLLTTIRMSIWAMVLASVLGILLGVFASRKRLLPRLGSSAYVGLIRNVPPLVFVFVFYFFVSSQIIPALGVDSWARGLGPTGERVLGLLAGPPERFENFIAGVLSLAMFEAAYIAVIVRAGIESVPLAQTEAAKSLGLGPWQTFRLVVFPQAFRAVTPPLANQFIMLVKDSSIVSLISVQELTFVGTEIAVSSQRRFETYIVVALFYFLLCFALSRLFARLEKRQRARSAA
ncbi:amino acid ABC transporter permease [Salipiger sp. P9]|uniref:amino acid ABC transporter permease n=1 Tax=Salipiger pentaromativorans TaxID=2943193 RepID=UPI00215738D0|nr:amino acid ABC transporter permease [Salipiger pentaromativorans]MCR8550543.1 amino acid ABC transporter permease [Salipiger pentaromativorans]